MYKVSILKCNSYNPNEIQKTLIESLKNINFDFSKYKNKKILIKPNLLCSVKPEKAITTHPIIIEELCKILKQYTSKIYIGDSSGDNTTKTLEVSGINKLSKHATILNFDKLQTKTFFIKNKNIPIPKIIFDFDLIINIAKIKTHSFTGITLCAKNLYGCISGKTKSYIHKLLPKNKDLSEIIIKITNLIKPQLNIIDAVEGIEGNGPGTAGTKIKSNLIIVSKNPFAADIITSEIMGFNSNEILTNKFSKIKKQDIKTIGDAKNTRLNFKKPLTYPFPLLVLLNKIFPKPKIDFNKELCQKCNICKEKCPVNAITLQPYPICNYKKCITCMCCMEVCPYNTIYLKDYWFKTLLKNIKNKILKND